MAQDAAQAVEFVERMIDAIGLREGLPPDEREAKLRSLYAEAERAFSDPELRMAANAYLDRWKNQVELGDPNKTP